MYQWSNLNHGQPYDCHASPVAFDNLKFCSWDAQSIDDLVPKPKPSSKKENATTKDYLETLDRVRQVTEANRREPEVRDAPPPRVNNKKRPAPNTSSRARKAVPLPPAVSSDEEEEESDEEEQEEEPAPKKGRPAPAPDVPTDDQLRLRRLEQELSDLKKERDGISRDKDKVTRESQLRIDHERRRAAEAEAAKDALQEQARTAAEKAQEEADRLRKEIEEKEELLDEARQLLEDSEPEEVEEGAHFRRIKRKRVDRRTPAEKNAGHRRNTLKAKDVSKAVVKGKLVAHNAQILNAIDEELEERFKISSAGVPKNVSAILKSDYGLREEVLEQFKGNVRLEQISRV